MSSTRSLIRVSFSAMPRPYHNARNCSKFERTMSLKAEDIHKSNELVLEFRVTHGLPLRHGDWAYAS
jgi:hypothetical protein